MHRGYTKRWRKRWDKGYHHDLLLWAMMDYMIDFAAYEDTEKYVNGIGLVKLKRGECIITIRGLADFFQVGPRQIRTRLDSLKNIGFSTQQTTQQTTQRASIYLVINYDTYQSCPNKSDTANDTQTDTRPTHHRHTTTSHPLDKEYKNNIKKEQNKTKVPHDDIIKLYHEILPEMPKIRLWNGKGRESLEARWATSHEFQSLDFWKELFSGIRRSDFLMGRADGRKWKCPGLNWIVLPTNFEKLVNGFYEGMGATKQKQYGPAEVPFANSKQQSLEDLMK